MALKVQIVLMKVALSNILRRKYVSIDDVDQWNILKVHSKLGFDCCTTFDVVMMLMLMLFFC